MGNVMMCITTPKTGVMQGDANMVIKGAAPPPPPMGAVGGGDALHLSAVVVMQIDGPTPTKAPDAFPSISLAQLKARHAFEVRALIEAHAARRVTQTEAARDLGITLQALSALVIKLDIHWPVEGQVLNSTTHAGKPQRSPERASEDQPQCPIITIARTDHNNPKNEARYV